jgi:hypothetical protein
MAEQGDGNMQRWKRAATPHQLSLALQGVVERISRDAKEGLDICVRLSTKKGCQGHGEIGSGHLTKIMQELIRLDDIVRDLEFSEGKLSQ